MPVTDLNYTGDDGKKRKKALEELEQEIRARAKQQELEQRQQLADRVAKKLNQRVEYLQMVQQREERWERENTPEVQRQRELAREAEAIAEREYVERVWKSKRPEDRADLGGGRRRVRYRNGGLEVGDMVRRDGEWVMIDRTMDDSWWEVDDPNYGERAAIEERRQWRAGW